MKPNAIIYTSNTGYTKRYAELLSAKTGLPAYTIEEANKNIEKGSSVIYMGWIFASNVKGYKKAVKDYNISVVCAVGLCDTGTLLDEVRKAISLSESTPLFTVQGGMDHSKLRGINKLMINMLTKGLSSKTEKSEDENRMLSLIQNGGDFVSEENLSEVLNWWKELNLV